MRLCILLRMASLKLENRNLVIVVEAEIVLALILHFEFTSHAMKILICILVVGLRIAIGEGALEIPKDYRLRSSDYRRPKPYPGQCDTPFTAVTGGHCYFSSYRLLRLNWHDAQTACQQLHPSGQLAQFESTDEILDATFSLADSNCSNWLDGPNDVRTHPSSIQIGTPENQARPDLKMESHSAAETDVRDSQTFRGMGFSYWASPVTQLEKTED
ncbi:unnamed protein product [Cyprideis torosa]|uniref:Uncharacterized protein n=1 Tax=Cyprideis torosa TaxID=163714 RepID=A0A7R8WLS9_9CRUS|nr:unnamed protein product [Cyprideis torosa]CAG0901958.1 unnamed protein product [Cyprideis torosa]